MKKKTLLGYCGVDSGQLMIADPCYLSDWKDTEHDANPMTRKSQFDFTYAGACQTTDNNNLGGQLNNDGGARMGVSFRSGYGDGVYPVYAEYNSEGRIKRVIVEMIDDDVENMDEEFASRAKKSKTKKKSKK